MPLQKLEFRPGVNRESTSLANEGGWFDSDKVRWRSGFPEKIGGWVKDQGTEFPTTPTTTFAADGTSDAQLPSSGTFWGVCRALFNWLNLSGYNLMALGTNLKYYIQNGVDSYIYDVTPIRDVSVAGAVTFTATTGSAVITCNQTAHGCQTGDFVIFTGALTLGGNITASVLNREHQVTFVDSDHYTIIASATANSSDTGHGGTGTIASYQITTGAVNYSANVGWGAGGWGGLNPSGVDTGWGDAASTSTGVGQQLRLWSQANYGEDLIFNPRGDAMYYWAVNANPNEWDRGQLMEAGGTITVRGSTINIQNTCPSQVNNVAISDGSRFVIAMGCNDPSGTLFSTTLDPLLIRWSDQEDFATWTPSVTNQAGDFRLSQGSQIVAYLQTRQEIIIWTDAAVYSMQYLGPPYTWGIQIMGSNTSIMGPNAVATASNVVYWMGTDKFYMYSGRVETLPCALRQYVYDDINLDQSYQFFASTNEGYNEVWWFYCSADSDEIDRYVVFNHLERTWYYGTMERVAWLDTPLRDFPTATTYDPATQSGMMVYHENGNDDGTTTPASPIEAYCQSSDFDIGDGHNFGMVWRIIPDVTFNGSTVDQPSVVFTVRPRQNPGTAYGSTDTPTVASAQNYTNQQTYNVQEFTEYAYVRIRGRQMAFRISSSDLGVAWQLGSPRLDLRPDGRR